MGIRERTMTNALNEQHECSSLVMIENEQVRSEGDIYCANNCGLGCTLSEYQQTVNDAEQLQKRLGPDWEVTVWDNLGWTYSATNGVASIYPPSDGPKSRWTCIINVPNLSGISGDGDTPEDAARNAARRVTDSINEMLNSFSKSVGPLIGHQDKIEN